MRIAVIGSEGYLGRALLPHLIDHTVLRYDAGLHGQRREGPVVWGSRKEDIISVLKGFRPDHIIWLAGFAHDPSLRVTGLAMWENNYGLPVEVLAQFQDIPTLVASSMSVYSQDLSLYALTKRALERWVLVGLNANVLRFGTLYGVGDPAAHRPHLLLNSMVLDAIRRNRITIQGDDIVRPTCSLYSAVNAIVEDLQETERGTLRNMVETCGTLRHYAGQVQSRVPEKVEIVVGPGAVNPGNGSYGTPDVTDLFNLQILIDRTRLHQNDFEDIRQIWYPRHLERIKEVFGDRAVQDAPTHG
jgi:nucleoside-diphosphate-sugar epimerase